MTTKTVDVDFELDEEAIEQVAQEFNINSSLLSESLNKAFNLSKTIDIQADLDDFTIDELIEVVADRSRHEQPDYVVNCIELLKTAIYKLKGTPPVEGIEINTLEDRIKVEHFAKIFDKYTSSQIEKYLPE